MIILILTTKTSMKKLPIKIDITTQEEKRDFEISESVAIDLQESTYSKVINI